MSFLGDRDGHEVFEFLRKSRDKDLSKNVAFAKSKIGYEVDVFDPRNGKTVPGIITKVQKIEAVDRNSSTEYAWCVAIPVTDESDESEEVTGYRIVQVWPHNDGLRERTSVVECLTHSLKEVRNLGRQRQRKASKKKSI